MIDNGFDWTSWGKTKVELLPNLVLGDFIAKGTRGEVYAATLRLDASQPHHSADAVDDRASEKRATSIPVAIKILRDYRRKAYSSDERYLREYTLAVAREVFLMQSVSSRMVSKCSTNESPFPPPILPLIDAYLSPDKNDLYLVMPRAVTSLRERMVKGAGGGHGGGEKLTVPQVKVIMRQLLTALSMLHNCRSGESALSKREGGDEEGLVLGTLEDSTEGYAHMDINSANVLLFSEGQGKDGTAPTATAAMAALLSDFSFCRPLRSAPLTTSGVFALGYRAPELLFLGGYAGKAGLVAEILKVAEEEEAEEKGFAQSTLSLSAHEGGGEEKEKKHNRTARKPSSSFCYALEKADVFAAGIVMCEMLLGRGTPPVTAQRRLTANGSKSGGDAHAEEVRAAVDSDVACRDQFLVLFTDLLGSFDHKYWSERFNYYKTLRETIASRGGGGRVDAGEEGEVAEASEADSKSAAAAALIKSIPLEDELPLVFEMSEDFLTSVMIKPKLFEKFLANDSESTGGIGSDDHPPLVVGEEGVAFLRLMLTPKFEDRPSAASLLRHPWLNGGADDVSANAHAHGGIFAFFGEPSLMAYMRDSISSASHPSSLASCEHHAPLSANASYEEAIAWLEKKVTKVATTSVRVQKR